MVDTIDPHAVDFTPFLQSHLNTPINYHDESHMLTKHHRKLQQKNQQMPPRKSSGSKPNSRSQSPIGQPGAPMGVSSMATRAMNGITGMGAATDDQQSVASFASTTASASIARSTHRSGMNGHRNKHSKSTNAQSSSAASVVDSVVTSITRHTIRPFLRGRAKDHDPHAPPPDRTKFVMLFMLICIALSVYRRNNAKVISSDPTATVEVKSNWLGHAPEGTVIPPDVDTAYRDVEENLGMMDTPIYWHVPRSGGTTMKLIMSMCMGRVVACEQGAGHQLDEVSRRTSGGMRRQ